MLKVACLILCIIGTALPYSQFVPFLWEEGLNVNALFGELFANQISGFFGMDVIASSLVFATFVFSEGSRLKMKKLWIYIASNLLVGVSRGLPLFLLMRQRKLEETPWDFCSCWVLLSLNSTYTIWKPNISVNLRASAVKNLKLSFLQKISSLIQNSGGPGNR